MNLGIFNEIFLINSNPGMASGLPISMSLFGLPPLFFGVWMFSRPESFRDWRARELQSLEYQNSIQKIGVKGKGKLMGLRNFINDPNAVTQTKSTGRIIIIAALSYELLIFGPTIFRLFAK